MSEYTTNASADVDIEWSYVEEDVIDFTADRVDMFLENVLFPLLAGKVYEYMLMDLLDEDDLPN